jgi:hypothetical protein
VNAPMGKRLAADLRLGNREAFMVSPELLTSDRIIDQSVAELLLRQEERRIRQSMRLHQEAWRKEHKPKRNVPTSSTAILLASGIFLGWAGSRFLDR